MCVLRLMYHKISHGFVSALPLRSTFWQLTCKANAHLSAATIFYLQVNVPRTALSFAPTLNNYTLQINFMYLSPFPPSLHLHDPHSPPLVTRPCLTPPYRPPLPASLSPPQPSADLITSALLVRFLLFFLLHSPPSSSLSSSSVTKLFRFPLPPSFRHPQNCLTILTASSPLATLTVNHVCILHSAWVTRIYSRAVWRHVACPPLPGVLCCDVLLCVVMWFGHVAWCIVLWWGNGTCLRCCLMCSDVSWFFFCVCFM